MWPNLRASVLGSRASSFAPQSGACSTAKGPHVRLPLGHRNLGIQQHHDARMESAAELARPAGLSAARLNRVRRDPRTLPPIPMRCALPVRPMSHAKHHGGERLPQTTVATSVFGTQSFVIAGRAQSTASRPSARVSQAQRATASPSRHATACALASTAAASPCLAFLQTLPSCTLAQACACSRVWYADGTPEGLESSSSTRCRI